MLKARILLKAALDTSIDTIARTRQQLVEGGLDAALTRKHSRSARQRIFDGAAEAKLIALACSPPPKGRELRKLFTSPIWTGCHPFFRSRQGDEVIRDARFWLPLLGLFHGNRLEEFAQLRREDVGQADGVPYLRITDEDGRQLKNEQSRRDVPLHSELIRIGFLDYVAEATALPSDQVFPELRPRGTDRKLGYSFSKQFSAYRTAIGVRRRGLDYHSFRHGLTTKLYQAEVAEAWIDLLTGHDAGGGESRRRYLKGIPLPQLRGALERVTWPELDLSALYLREAGDERWPMR